MVRVRCTLVAMGWPRGGHVMVWTMEEQRPYPGIRCLIIGYVVLVLLTESGSM